MKRILLILKYTVLLFIVLTLVTAIIGTPSDGDNKFGFPFPFYKIYGGKRSSYLPNEFSAVMLLLDVVFIYLAVWLANILLIKAKAKKENT